MANHKSGAQRYNDRMDKIWDKAKSLERERLARGEMPNPSLTSPEDARKHGWEIKGREVRKIVAKKMRSHHAKLADELNTRNKATPKKYKRYLQESHDIAAENRGNNEN